MITNVYVYVADSLRWDHLPPAAADDGVAVRTVAQSTFSAPSFASLATGLYPQQHGILDWHDRLPSTVRTIFELDGVEAGFWQAGETAGHEIYPILRRDGKTDPAQLDEPFVFIERNDDPHVPFGGTDVTSAAAYYETRGGDTDRIRAEYERGVQRSLERFERRMDDLADRGVLDETLVVFTSDHGELLGEHGEVSHTTPVCPELAYVPTVFVHPDIGPESLHCDPDEEVVEHVDVVATLLGALGRGESLEPAGVDLLARPRPREWGYSHVDLQRWDRSMYVGDGIWWPGGGYAFHRSSLPRRLATALHRITRSPSRSSVAPVDLLRTYLPEVARFREPPVSQSRARRSLELFCDGLGRVQSRSVELDSSVEQTLEAMGYR